MKKFTLIFMFLISLRGLAQLPLQDFEGTWTPLTGTSGPAGPDGWYIRNERGPIQRWTQVESSTWPAHSGTHAAYINRENVTEGTTEDWLITPVFNVPNNAQLKFWSFLTLAGDQSTVYKIFIGTDPTDISTFTELQSWTELEINPDQTTYTEKVVDIPATHLGTQKYIAFVMQGDNGDRWVIDDVQVVEQCFVPTALTANPSGTSAVLSWTGSSAGYEVEVLPATDTPNQAGETTLTNSYTTPETLSPSTAYVYYVRSVCAPGNYSAWAGPFAFTTTQIPAQLNYTEGFETATQWSLVNGTQTNKWIIGSAAAAVNAGTQSLYISNTGTTYNYDTFSGSVVQAYRDVFIPATAEQLNLSFNWKSYGENNNDYVRVWLAPATYTPVAGTLTTVANSGATQLTQNLFLNNNWNTFSGNINVTPAMAGTVRRLIFEWRNDVGGGTPPPAAIDNINFSIVTCPTPSNLALGTTTQNSATFTWTAPVSVTPTYDFYFSTVNTAPTALTSPTANVPTTSLTLNSLASLTTYYIWIRSNCGGGDTSAWVGPIAFTTTQVPATLNLTQNFEGTSGFGFTTMTSVSNKWVVGTAASNGGTRALYVSNDNGVSNAYAPATGTVVHAFRDILVPAGTNELSVSFDWRGLGETNDYMRVWLLPTTYLPVSGTQITAAASGGAMLNTANFSGSASWRNYANNINVAAYSGRICRLVFEWVNDGVTTNQPPAAVDNLNVNIVTCPRPTNFTVTPAGTSATLAWTPGGTETSWEVYVINAAGTPPTAATVGTQVDTATGYVYSPLTPITTYQAYVRAVCSDSDKSIWFGPVSFTTTIANDNCSGALPLVVNPAEACVVSTNGAFTGATVSTLPACSGVNGPDIWYQFTATGTSNIVSIADVGPAFVNEQTDPTRGLVLTVYENACDNLNPIACSIVNYIRVKDLVPGQVYYVRVSQDAATPNLNVTFSICVTTPAPPTSGNASECLITTVNSSFENPIRTTLPSNTNPIMYSHNQVQGWRTTANDHVMEFWPTPNSENVPAYDGVQFIEINANRNQGVMGVYQDFATPSPTTFTIKFAHRGRRGNDTMQILAGDASQSPSTYTTRIGNRDFTSGNGAWVYYGADNSLTYTVPEGQTVTRFFFRAVSTSTGDTSIGNFLDAITFTADNSIVTANTSTTCGAPPVSVDARGDGNWVAHSDNPSATAIANSRANRTTISGFSAPGVYMYDWVTAYCTSTLEITYTAPVIAAPTTTQDTYTYCAGATATTLNATVDSGSGFTLNWYNVAAGGTALGAAPTPSTATPGVYMFYVSQGNGTCEGPRLPFTITVNAVPTAPAATGATYCINAPATALTATADAGNTLNWYTTATGGTASATAPTPDTTIAATTTYYVSQTTAAGCEGPRTAITIIVTTAITQPTDFTLATTVCIAGANPTATLLAASTTGGTFSSSNPTNLVIDPSTGVIDLTRSVPGIYNIKYELPADPANCLALSSTTHSIEVKSLTPAMVSFTYPTVCAVGANIRPVPNTAGFTTGGSYTSSNPSLLIVDINTGEINVAASTPGSYTVTYSVGVNNVDCVDAGTSAAIPVTINALSVPNTTYHYDPVCGLATTLAPTYDPGFVHGGTYSTTAAASDLALNADGTINVANSTPGTYTVYYNLPVDTANCRAAAVNIAAQVVINTPSIALTGFNYSNTTVCANTPGTLTVAQNTGFTMGGTFSVVSSNASGLIINPTTGEITINGSTPGVYDVQYTVGSNATSCVNGGTSPSVRITITPSQTPVAGFNYSTNYCYGTGTVTPSYDTGFSNTGTFTVTGGLTINPTTGEISLAGVQPGQYTVTYDILADPANCKLANRGTFTFTLNGEIDFSVEGDCQGPSFIITTTPLNNSFDPDQVVYEWTTAAGVTVGDNSPSLNVSDYIRGLGNTAIVYPITFNVTVHAGICTETMPYVVDGITCQIPRGISPGGSDLLNEYFDLSGFQVSKLSIFNRYGLEVYSRNNYVKEWKGQTNSGDELPTGTYFYMMESPSVGKKTGWIYINRQN